MSDVVHRVVNRDVDMITLNVDENLHWESTTMLHRRTHCNVQPEINAEQRVQQRWNFCSRSIGVAWFVAVGSRLAATT